MKKFVFAPDSFKGSLSAMEICALLAEASKRHFPQTETVSIPVADGGEGTVDALLLATGGRRETVRVTGPMGAPVEAAYGILPDGETAVLEMAQASGLALVPAGQLNPLRATSFGTGEMLRHVLDSGYRRVLLGIGGSATNDGGMGMLSALGARFTDDAGEVLSGTGEALERVAGVDLAGLHPALAEAELRVICDVNNPLLGEQGATAVYVPQKGADAPMRARLEAGMARYAQLVSAAAGRDIAIIPGAGAAGGMGAALAGVLGAALLPGIAAVLDTVGFDDHLQAAGLVITGEGRIDGQSIRFGKVPAGVAARCARRGVPVVAIVGGMADGAEALYDIAEASIITTINAAMPVEEAMRDARALFAGAADRMFRMLRIGMGLRE